MNIEIWKDIKGFENKYQISNLGRIKSLLTNKYLKHCINGSGYYLVTLCFKGKKYNRNVHKLLADAFLIKENDNLVVDHINNNPLDNRLENLQFVTHRINVTKDKKNKVSKYVGVTYEKKCNKWRARIRLNKMNISLGYFDNEYEAHLRYEQELQTISK
jgi:hypothetical protein